VDDGAPSIKESLKMVLEAESMGVKAIILTPHFHIGLFNNIEKVEENYYELRYRVRDCGIDLYLGYEVFIDSLLHGGEKIAEKLKLNNSPYLLMELPFDVVPSYSFDILYKLHLNDIIPIIAHPERNRFFVNNFNMFMNFIENGCLLQLDAASIIGVYGSEVQNFSKKLIKSNLAHFVASDAHSHEDYKEWYLAARRNFHKCKVNY